MQFNLTLDNITHQNTTRYNTIHHNTTKQNIIQYNIINSVYFQHKNVGMPWGDCKDKQLKYFTNYTIHHCREECLIDQVQDKCNCSLIFLPHNGKDDMHVFRHIPIFCVCYML